MITKQYTDLENKAHLIQANSEQLSVTIARLQEDSQTYRDKV